MVDGLCQKAYQCPLMIVEFLAKFKIDKVEWVGTTFKDHRLFIVIAVQ